MDLPREDALRWLVSRLARLRSAHGDVIGTPELLQPTGRYFPDAFTHDGESVARLLARMRSYAPLSEEIDVRLRFVEDDQKEQAGGCGTGGCGSGACSTEENTPKDRVVALGDGYVVELPVADVGHSTVLTTALARAVGALVLFEADEEIEDGELGPMSEVAAHAYGAGVLLASGAYVYGKSCGGVRVQQHTFLSVEEHAVLLAVHCQVHGVKPSVATANLETTQRQAFDEAWAWAGSNTRLLDDLASRPETLVDGVFEIEPVRGIFGRLFQRKSNVAAPSPPAIAPKPRKERTAEEERRLAEARALVEEALGQGS